MNALDSRYANLLRVGFIVIRQAIDSGDRSWVDAELELLHNVPSLIGEDNVERHRYFWVEERMHYIDWVSQPGRETAKSRMQTFYAPIWSDMESSVLAFIDSEGTA